ncbi:kelch-like protein 20 [Glandiceps talaboti]
MGECKELMYKDGCQPNSLLETLQSFRASGTHCDVVIKVGQHNIPAHRLVLSACSPYFRAMFTSKLMESGQRCIVMRDLDPVAMNDLINFAYTAEIKINEHNVQNLLVCSNLVQLTGVRNACCEFLEKQLHPSNCIGIWHFADVHSCHDLAEKAHQYVYEHLTEVAKEDEFQHLGYDQFMELVNSDFLGVESESEVFEAVLTWIKFKPKERICHLGMLLENVRLFQVSSKFLQRQLQEEKLLHTDEECFKMLSDVQQILQETDVSMVMMKFGKGKRLCHGKRPKCLVAMGGDSNGSTLSCMQCHVVGNNNWTSHLPQTDLDNSNKSLMPCMKTPRSAFGVVSNSRVVYIVGGSNSMHALSSVERYDVAANKWTEMTPMQCARNGVSVSLLNGQLYACGGQDNSKYLDTVEVYSDQSKSWSYVTSMHRKRAFFGTVAVGGMLYAVGGTGSNAGNQGDFLLSVERYDPSQNRWAWVAPMHESRAYLSVTVLNGYIYAIGGHCGIWLNTVERYDPQANHWMYVKSLKNLRSSASATALDGYIYVVGGFDGRKCTNTMEKYEPAKDKWSSECPLSQRRYAVGLASIIF